MPDAVSAPESITELKVSAHLMTLDAGVFCVFPTPGAMASNPASGLPGVRITLPPATGTHDGAVTITGFSDGWLGAATDAALIRVTGGSAQVLVTVYQETHSERAAPKLQFIRLTDDTPAPDAEPAPEPQASAPIEVAAHVYGVGDVGGRIGDWMGERGSKRWIEGFGLAPSNGIATSDLEYQAVLGRGWLSPWSEGGQFCGSRGMSLPILGMRVRLRGAAAEAFTASVQATFIDGTEIGPVAGGEACEAPSLAALEAFRVSFDPRVPASEPARGRLAASPAASPEPGQSGPAPKAARKAPVRKAEPAPTAAAPRQAPAKPAAAPSKPAAKTGKPAAQAPTPKAAPKRTPATTRRR